MAGSFSDGVRLMTALQESARISETLNKQVNLLHEASDHVKNEAEKKVKELAPLNKEANSSVQHHITEFSDSMVQVANQSDKVIQKCLPVQAQCEKILAFYSSDSDVTLDDIKKLIQDLQFLRSSANSLYSLFLGLNDCIVEAESALKELRNHCGIEAEKAGGKANAIKVGGGAGSGAAGGAAVSLGIAGIFFPPLLIGAAVCGAGAIAGGIVTGIDAKKMDELKASFNKLNNSLDSVVKALAKIGDDIRASVQATDNLLMTLNNAERRARNVEEGIRNREVEELRRRLGDV